MDKSMGFLPEVGVMSVSRSIAFYAAAFGAEEVESVPGEDGTVVWAEMDVMGSRIMFQEVQSLVDELPGLSADSTGAIALVLRVEPAASARAIEEQVRSMEVTIDSGPTTTDYGSIEFSIRDPDGNVVVVAGRD